MIKKYRGVSPIRGTSRFRVQVQHEGKAVLNTTRPTLDESVKLYIEAKRRVKAGESLEGLVQKRHPSRPRRPFISMDHRP
jgi:hypothetical protein